MFVADHNVATSQVALFIGFGSKRAAIYLVSPFLLKIFALIFS